MSKSEVLLHSASTLVSSLTSIQYGQVICEKDWCFCQSSPSHLLSCLLPYRNNDRRSKTGTLAGKEVRETDKCQKCFHYFNFLFRNFTLIPRNLMTWSFRALSPSYLMGGWQTTAQNTHWCWPFYTPEMLSTLHHCLCSMCTNKGFTQSSVQQWDCIHRSCRSSLCLHSHSWSRAWLHFVYYAC